MDTPEKLRQVIEQGIQSNINFKDGDYDLALERLWTVLFETTTALKNITDQLDPSKIPDKDFTSLLILTNCLVDAHAGYQSMRQGFHRAAAIVFRGLLENMALSIAIKADETDSIYNQYKDGKYDIPKAIGPASKRFSEIGKLYGILSNSFAHEPHEAIGRAFIQEGATTIILLVPPVGRNDFMFQFLLISKLALLVCQLGEVIEWTFANYVDPKVYWQWQDDTYETLSRVAGNPGLTAVREITAQLEAIMQKRTSIHPPNSQPGKDE